MELFLSHRMFLSCCLFLLLVINIFCWQYFVIKDVDKYFLVITHLRLASCSSPWLVNTFSELNFSCTKVFSLSQSSLLTHDLYYISYSHFAPVIMCHVRSRDFETLNVNLFFMYFVLFVMIKMSLVD